MKHLKTFKQIGNNDLFEAAGRPLDFVTASKVFNEKLRSWGIETRPLTPGDIESAEENDKGDKVIQHDNIKIDPKTLGSLSPVFKDIDLNITAVYGEKNQAMVVVLQYDWEHPSGSNGYTIRDSYWNGEWVGY